MWICLNNAFVSAVQHYDDPNLLVVRARAEGDLERVFAGDEFGVIDVERHEDRDYLYRTIVTKKQFAQAMEDAVLGIDYHNFKDSIGTNGDDPHENARHSAYYTIWSAMNGMQRRVHGVGKYIG